MEWLLHILGPDKDSISALQMTARGLVIFAYGILVVRTLGHRIFGKIGAFDVVLSVIVGSSLSRALTGNAPLLQTLAATTVLVLAHWLLAHLALRSPALGWLIKGRAVPLVRQGQLDRKAMMRQGISDGDLREALRAEGLSGLDQCEEAFLERNGSISVAKKRG